ncbi:MAG: hypothetical protein ACXADY_05880 [Candidatus Hodarchaeales archaeon]|jgi:hypothetical protein
MTAHSRRNRRGRTEIDIATKYFEEEEEKTKALLEKKKRQNASGSPRILSSKKTSLINSPTEKKNKKYPKTKIKRSPSSNLSSQSYRKKVIKNQKGRIVNNKSKERKKRLKRVRAQYSKRYNI